MLSEYEESHDREHLDRGGRYSLSGKKSGGSNQDLPEIQASLPPESARRLEVAETLHAGDGDPARLLALANRALNEDKLSLARPVFERLASSQSAGRFLPEIKTKLGWCYYLDQSEKNNKAAEALWQDVIRETRPTDPWYAESRWHLVQLEAGPKDNWEKGGLPL